MRLAAAPCPWTFVEWGSGVLLSRPDMRWLTATPFLAAGAEPGERAAGQSAAGARARAHRAARACAASARRGSCSAAAGLAPATQRAAGGDDCVLSASRLDPSVAGPVARPMHFASAQRLYLAVRAITSLAICQSVCTLGHELKQSSMPVGMRRDACNLHQLIRRVLSWRSYYQRSKYTTAGQGLA